MLNNLKRTSLAILVAITFSSLSGCALDESDAENTKFTSVHAEDVVTGELDELANGERGSRNSGPSSR